RLLAVDRTEVCSKYARAELEAATAECADQLHLVGFVTAIAEPERGWRQLTRYSEPEQRAYLLAATLGCMGAQCSHLRKAEGPQLAYVRLPLRRIDCGRCVGTWRRPPAEDSDRCDICGGRGIDCFVPFAL